MIIKIVQKGMWKFRRWSLTSILPFPIYLTRYPSPWDWLQKIYVQHRTVHWQLRRILFVVLSRKVDFVQSSEILILHFCASMEHCTQPATHVSCLIKLIDFLWLKCSSCMKIVSVFNLMTSYWVRYQRLCGFDTRELHFSYMEDISIGKNQWFLGSW